MDSYTYLYFGTVIVSLFRVYVMLYASRLSTTVLHNLFSLTAHLKVFDFWRHTADKKCK